MADSVYFKIDSEPNSILTRLSIFENSELVYRSIPFDFAHLKLRPYRLLPVRFKKYKQDFESFLKEFFENALHG